MAVFFGPLAWAFPLCMQEGDGEIKREREGENSLVSFLIRALILSDQSPPLWPHLTLITSLEAPSLTIATQGLRLHYTNFGGKFWGHTNIKSRINLLPSVILRSVKEGKDLYHHLSMKTMKIQELEGCSKSLKWEKVKLRPIMSQYLFSMFLYFKSAGSNFEISKEVLWNAR